MKYILGRMKNAVLMKSQVRSVLHCSVMGIGYHRKRRKLISGGGLEGGEVLAKSNNCNFVGWGWGVLKKIYRSLNILHGKFWHFHGSVDNSHH